MQVYSQLGDDTPDVEVSSLKAMYNTTQSLIADDKIAAGHDISDGGIAVTLLEAAFAGNCGLQVPHAPLHLDKLSFRIASDSLFLFCTDSCAAS